MSRSTTCFALGNREEQSVRDRCDSFANTRKKEDLYEMIFATTNELKSMRHNEDRDEFRTFRKEYEIEERKRTDDTSFREDIRH